VDYLAIDTENGKYLSNTVYTQKLPVDQYAFYVTFEFDEEGNVQIGSDLKGSDPAVLRRIVSNIIRGSQIEFVDGQFYTSEQITPVAKLLLTNMKVTFAISSAAFLDETIPEEFWIPDIASTYAYDPYDTPDYEFYEDYIYYYPSNRYTSIEDCLKLFWLINLGILLIIIVIPKRTRFPILRQIVGAKPWEHSFLCRLPMEFFLLAVICFIPYVDVFRNDIIVESLSESYVDTAYAFLLSTLAFLGVYLVGLNAKAYFTPQIWGVIKKRSICLRVCQGIYRFMRTKGLAIYEKFVSVPLTKRISRQLLLFLLLHTVILALFCCIWFAGIIFVLIYSIILYFVLRKNLSKYLTAYNTLLEATNQIAQGNSNVTINQNLGVFDPFVSNIEQIQVGIRKAVDEETKSQRMKAELITNVSHDLKTPLTAIISYIDLLKREENKTNQTPEEEASSRQKRTEYITTLENKSDRLRTLIEDLFELSKTASKNITLNTVDLDLIDLVKQVALETADKMKEANLDLRFHFPAEKIILPLDSQKTYRVYENLFVNISKYALPGTRVYVHVDSMQDTVRLILKNITKQEILVTPEELTERFVRGDESRNTQGSGLGLSIAKGFVEIQGGTLTIEIDDDVFKVTTTWKRFS
jgi:signal transduction histidine kinase